MAVGTPFHDRVRALCHSYAWRQWSGYLAVSSFNDFVQPEYAAIRNAAALIDISPLYKYEVSGRQAAQAINHVITHDAVRMKIGQVIYTPWCDADGAVRQEGTVFRLADDRFMIAAAEPAFEWFRGNALGFDASWSRRSAWAWIITGRQSRRSCSACTCSTVRIHCSAAASPFACASSGWPIS